MRFLRDWFDEKRNAIVVWRIRRRLRQIRSCPHEWRPARLFPGYIVCPKCRRLLPVEEEE